MEAIIFVCAIVCILIGYLAAKIEFTKKLKSTRTKAYWNGFEVGNEAALKDAGEVRRAYNYHFGNLK